MDFSWWTVAQLARTAPLILTTPLILSRLPLAQRLATTAAQPRAAWHEGHVHGSQFGVLLFFDFAVPCRRIT